jgi:predicted nucleic acid-binding Zn ribbon protein
MKAHCVVCGIQIKDGDGYYNYPSGLECIKCGQPKPRKNRKTLNKSLITNTK